MAGWRENYIVRVWTEQREVGEPDGHSTRIAVQVVGLDGTTYFSSLEELHKFFQVRLALERNSPAG